jgi:putative SOS response-associated peptidase YedK
MHRRISFKERFRRNFRHGLKSPAAISTTGQRLRSCAMVITEPNKLVAGVHDHMPVVLEAKDFEQWETGDVKDAAALMKPADEDILQKWPVSKRVNGSRADDNDATLMEAVALVG